MGTAVHPYLSVSRNTLIPFLDNIFPTPIYQHERHLSSRIILIYCNLLYVTNVELTLTISQSKVFALRSSCWPRFPLVVEFLLSRQLQKF